MSGGLPQPAQMAACEANSPTAPEPPQQQKPPAPEISVWSVSATTVPCNGELIINWTVKNVAQDSTELYFGIGPLNMYTTDIIVYWAGTWGWGDWRLLNWDWKTGTVSYRYRSFPCATATYVLMATTPNGTCIRTVTVTVQ